MGHHLTRITAIITQTSIKIDNMLFLGSTCQKYESGRVCQTIVRNVEILRGRQCKDIIPKGLELNLQNWYAIIEHGGEIDDHIVLQRIVFDDFIYKAQVTGFDVTNQKWIIELGHEE